MLNSYSHSKGLFLHLQSVFIKEKFKGISRTVPYGKYAMLGFYSKLAPSAHSLNTLQGFFVIRKQKARKSRIEIKLSAELLYLIGDDLSKVRAQIGYVARLAEVYLYRGELFLKIYTGDSGAFSYGVYAFIAR